MRCFLAIDLPEFLKKEVGKKNQDIKKQIPNLKWVKPENYHITVKFFGEIPDQRVEGLSNNLDKMLKGKGVINLELTALGAFPTKKRARVLWIGVNGDLGTVKRIFRKVEEIAEMYGIAKEKRGFSLHLTIARAKKPVDITEIDLGKIKNSGFKTNKLTLFKSQLTPEGPIYSVVREFYLYEEETY